MQSIKKILEKLNTEDFVNRLLGNMVFLIAIACVAFMIIAVIIIPFMIFSLSTALWIYGGIIIFVLIAAILTLID